MRTIPEKESISVEFKSDRDKKSGRGLSDDVLVEAVVGMANAEGGEIYIGVEDNGAITGVGRNHADETGVVALIGNLTVPHTYVTAMLLTEEGKNVLKIQVPKARSIVSTSSGKVVRRSLKMDKTPENIPMYPHEYATRISDLGLLDPSAQIIPGATLDDLSPEERKRLREVIRRYNGETTLSSLEDTEFDRALGFIKDMDGALRPTLTGLLMIGRAESLKKHAPTAGVRFQALQGTLVKTNDSFTLPIASALERLEEYIKAWNPEHEYQEGLYRLAVPEFSWTAIREGLVNAFSHRDYTRLGDVLVMVDDAQLKITSPGGFIEGVTADNLLTVTPQGRNPQLADALKRIGLAERTGRGIDRIFEGSARFGRPLPDFSGSTIASVCLSLSRAKPDYAFMKLINDEENSMGRSFSISALLILFALHSERRLTLKELAVCTHTPESSLRPHAETLLERGLLTAIGESRNRAYLLSPRVYKATHNQEGHLRQILTSQEGWQEKIVDIISQAPNGMKRGELVEATGLSVSAVSRLLKLLVGKGKLHIQGKARATVYMVPK